MNVLTPTQPDARHRVQRPVARPRRWRVRTSDLWAVALGNAAVIAAMWVYHGGIATLSAAGGWFIGAGQLCGLYGTFLILVQLLLMSRSPWLEQLLGRDRLVAGHRLVGFWSVALIVAHAALITLGYAAAAHATVVAQAWALLSGYPDVLMAVVGFAMFLGVGLTSVRIARRAMAYETWYFVHLYAYAAIALTFAHQLANGADFVSDPVARAYWIALYVLTFGCLAAFRVAQPLVVSIRHQPRVYAVVPEAPSVVSIYLTGRRLDRLAAEPGQFFQVRFLTRDGWWRSHPFSLSAAPNGHVLRFTVKALGDWTSSLMHLRPGVRVMLEGPYGAMTAARRSRARVLLIAGGVGVTPLRALLESLPAEPGGVTLIYRASRWEDVLFRAELDLFAAQRGVLVHYLVGQRGSREMPGDPLSADSLHRLVPDVAHRDVYVCGPDPMTHGVERALTRLGVPSDHIHAERFTY